MSVTAAARRESVESSLSLLQNLTMRTLRAEYKRTMLGRLWSLLNPIAQIAVFSVVFGLVIRIEPPPGQNSGVDFFPLWIGIGVVTWTFFSGAMNAGMGALTGNAGLLSKVYFERWVLVVSEVLPKAVTYLIEIGVIVLIMAFVGGPQVLLLVPLLLPVVLIITMFVTGLALLLSVALVYFRDLSHLWAIVTQVWMYASGVIFPVSLVATAQDDLSTQRGIDLPLVTWFELNPAERMIDMVRSIVYGFEVPELAQWSYSAGWALGMLVLGALVFAKFSRNIVEEL